MNEVEKLDKINKKLAEWVFPTALDIEVCDGHILVITDKETAVIEEYFTQSLDACFKWLVPKVVDEGYLFLSALFDDWLDELEEEKEPALALCLAIEKLIDGEVKND